MPHQTPPSPAPPPPQCAHWGTSPGGGGKIRRRHLPFQGRQGALARNDMGDGDGGRRTPSVSGTPTAPSGHLPRRGRQDTPLTPPPKGEARDSASPCFPLGGKSPVRTLGNRGQFQSVAEGDTAIPSFLHSASAELHSSFQSYSGLGRRRGSSTLPKQTQTRPLSRGMWMLASSRRGLADSRCSVPR